MTEAVATSVATPAKKEVAIETIRMEDGRQVDFAGKKKMQKESFIAADGSISIRLDFRNGRTLLHTIRSDMKDKYAAHGGEQKLGDEIAGVEDIDDCVLAEEELILRLEAGEWTVKREGTGMSGTSILLRAIVNVTGKPIDAIKAYLTSKTQAQKIALRDSSKFRDEVARLEAEKTKKTPKVNVDAEVEELMNLPA